MAKTKKKRQSQSHISTGDWDILGDDRIRRWPNEDDPRRIKVDIHSWVGASPDAKHVDVRVSEEENTWWSESEQSWCTIYSDSSARGYELEAKVMTRKEAEEFAHYAVEFIKKANPKQPYDVGRIEEEDDEDDDE